MEGRIKGRMDEKKQEGGKKDKRRHGAREVGRKGERGRKDGGEINERKEEARRRGK